MKRIYTKYRWTASKGWPTRRKVVEFHGSLLKENIVMYGDPISDDCIEMLKKDLVDDVDLMIVMGTSL